MPEMSLLKFQQPHSLFLKQYSLCCPSFGEEGFTYELKQIGKAKNLKKSYNKGLSEAEPSKNEGLQLLRTW